MVRYLGQKPVNWAAMALIFGWLAVGALYMFWGAGVVSTFRAGLAEPPLMWWPDMSFVGFVLIMSPVLLGAVALWLVPASDWSRGVSVGLIATGAVLFVAGAVWDASYGVALYPDRVVHQAAGFGQRPQTDRFADIRRVETSCVVRAGRGGGVIPSYTLGFASGARVDLWRRTGLGVRGDAAERLAVIQAADAAVTRNGALRAPRRKPDGTLIGDPGCLIALGDSLTIPPPVLAPLFNVHQSELRPGEYDVEPDGAPTEGGRRPPGP